jgi:DNA polymerase elongation subunit (family B)
MTKFYTSVVKYGNKLLFRYVNNGQSYKSKVNFNPSFFFPSKDNTPTQFKSLDGKFLSEMNFGDMNEAKDFEEKYKDIQNFQVYGQNQFQYQYIAQEYPGEIKWDKDLIKVFSIDIETSTEEGFPDLKTANEEILLITVKDNTHKQIVTFTSRQFVSDRPDVRVEYSANEAQMLRNFAFFWKDNCPDVVTGWNIEGFDIPYLVNRIKRVLGEDYVNYLSPWGIVRDKKLRISADKSIDSYAIVGVSILDYLAVYKKFTYTNQESYRLDYIAQVELGENKLENPEDNFKDFYTKHWDMFVKYNIHDVELVDKLEDKMKLIELIFTLAYSSKINFEDVYSPVRMWDVIIYNYLRDKNIVIPLQKDSTKSESFEGAYVKDPLIGQHKWVASFDLNSLYPHLIMQYNMSPETLVQDVMINTNVEKLLNSEIDTSEAHNKGIAMTANGWCYRKDIKGFLPTLMEEMYTNRSKFKKQMLKVQQEYEQTKNKDLLKEISKLNNLQMAMKIALNSAYGAVGNRYFRYYDLRIAEGITLSGQLSIRWMANKLNAFMNKTLKTENADYVIAIDTDSIYLSLETLVEKVCAGKTDEEKIKFMDKTCDTIIQPVIDNGYQELATYMNAYDQKMQMKREVLADKGIWVAKKRYVLNVHNSEGVQYAEPKIKVMGLEMVKSSTPSVVRSKLKDALKVILYKAESDLQEFVQTFKAEFSSLPVEEIAFPRSVSDLKAYTDKQSIYGAKTPIHVRGSLLYNHYVKQKGLDKKYQLIGNGDKIKFIYLKKRNPINENVIAFQQELPKELGLEQYIDYDLQFEKTFTDAIDIVIRPLGWSSERQASLDLLFA